MRQLALAVCLRAVVVGFRGVGPTPFWRCWFPRLVSFRLLSSARHLGLKLGRSGVTAVIV